MTNLNNNGDIFYVYLYNDIITPAINVWLPKPKSAITTVTTYFSVIYNEYITVYRCSSNALESSTNWIEYYSMSIAVMDKPCGQG